MMHILQRLKQQNMASGAVIRVYVLEGQYTQLSNLGFLASLLLELQERGLRLDNSKWSSRHSDAGFSVSFFWPAALTSRRRQRRQRKRKQKPKVDLNTNISNHNHHQPSDIPPAAAMLPKLRSASPSLIPPNAHHPQPSFAASHCLTDVPSSSSPTLQQSQDLPETDNSVSELSATSRSPDVSECLTAETGSEAEDINNPEEVADSLKHLDDADSVEFEIKDDEPVVKHTTRGKVGWTPIRVTNHFSTEGEEYSVEYLKNCKKIGILCNEDTGWRASIRCGSVMFSIPIAARTCSRTSRDIT